MAMILRETGLLLVVGVVVGVALSAMGMRLITSRLFGLAPTDPLAFAMAIACLREWRLRRPGFQPIAHRKWIR